MQLPLQALPQQMPEAQNVLVQSGPPWHALPSPHGGQLPPQSTSASSPSFTLSAQAVHLPFVQSVAGEAQSATDWHPWPRPHLLEQCVPPQSRPVSSPSFMPSVQLPHAPMKQ